MSPGNGMICDSPSSGQNQDILTAPVYLSAEMHELVNTVGSGEAGSSFIVGLVNEDLKSIWCQNTILIILNRLNIPVLLFSRRG